MHMPKKSLQEHINQDQREFNRSMGEHARIANQEMGTVKETLVEHGTLLKVLADDVKSVNAKQWAIIALIVAAAIAVLFKK